MNRSRFQVGRYGWQRDLSESCFVDWLRRIVPLNLSPVIKCSSSH